MISKSRLGSSRLRYRGGGSTGAEGAFAPVNFQQQVHCTHPDKKLSYTLTFFSPKMNFFSPKRNFLEQKMWYNFKFCGCWIIPLPLKKLCTRPVRSLTSPLRYESDTSKFLLLLINATSLIPILDTAHYSRFNSPTAK